MEDLIYAKILEYNVTEPYASELTLELMGIITSHQINKL